MTRAAQLLRELVAAEWMVTHDWGGDRKELLERIDAALCDEDAAMLVRLHADVAHEREWKRQYQAECEVRADRIEALEAELEQARAAKDAAYLERNHLVAALAKLFPSGVSRTNIPGWSENWHGCCYIDLPTGQISYHFHDSHAHLFAGLRPYRYTYDGHEKDEVHRRLALLPAEPKERT